MPLTFFLKNPDVRDRFKEQFPVPKVKLQSIIHVSPSKINPGTVGTAFDYLLRFHVERINKNVVSSQWVAENALESLEPREREIVEPVVLDARKHHSKFIKTGKLEDKLIKSTLELARLDVVQRVGLSLFDILDDIPDENVKEIRSLYDVAVKSEIFQSRRKCFLNPTFGEGSILIGGADADLIIGDTLIDIKTVKHLKFNQGFYNQILGYYLLSELGGQLAKVRNVAIYFSRHGVLYSLPVDNLKKEKGFISFVKWFVERAENERQKQFSVLSALVKKDKIDEAKENFANVVTAVKLQIKRMQKEIAITNRKERDLTTNGQLRGRQKQIKNKKTGKES